MNSIKNIVAAMALTALFSVVAACQTPGWKIEDVTDPANPVAITNAKVKFGATIHFNPQNVPEGCSLQIISMKHLYVMKSDGSYNEATLPVGYVSNPPAPLGFSLTVPADNANHYAQQIRVKWVLRCNGVIISHHEMLLDIVKP